MSTRMSYDEATGLAGLLRAMPPETGLVINRCTTPPGSAEYINGTVAKVVLPCGAVGEANGDNPATAVQNAWGRAHLAAARRLLGDDL